MWRAVPADFDPAVPPHTLRRVAHSHPKLLRGQVWCTECGHNEKVNVEIAMSLGWLKHCGQTMTIDAPDERK